MVFAVVVGVCGEEAEEAENKGTEGGRGGEGSIVTGLGFEHVALISLSGVVGGVALDGSGDEVGVLPHYFWEGVCTGRPVWQILLANKKGFLVSYLYHITVSRMFDMREVSYAATLVSVINPNPFNLKESLWHNIATSMCNAVCQTQY